MSIFKRISDEDLAELVDSVVIMIGDDDGAIRAGVSWAVDGNVDANLGPMTVPAAIHLAEAKARELGKGPSNIFVNLERDTVQWDEGWGELV